MRVFTHIRRGARNGVFTLFCVTATAGLLSGCVSDTLDTSSTQPIGAANQKLNYDPVQRAQAVAEMRQKAKDSDSGVLTNAYAAADGPNEPLPQNVSAAKIENMQQAVEQTAATSPDDELAAKQRRMKELQQKARTHYGSAVNAIEN